MSRKISWRLTAIFAVMVASASTAQQPQQTGSLRFVVAAIKPSAPGGLDSRSVGGMSGGTFRLVNEPLKLWVEMALSVSDGALKAPSWLDGARFDLDARLPVGKAVDKKSVDEMMRNLMVERFGLKWHEDQRTVSGYELMTGKKLLLKASDLSNPLQRRGRWRGTAMIGGHNMPMSDLATRLGEALGKPVVDKTHLSGGFEINLRWRPDDAAALADAQQRGMPDLDNLPSIFTAVQEQLGLLLRRAQVRLDVVVVDSINRQPTQN